jgi:hypothetical protein
MKFLDGTQKRNDLSLLMWVDLLGACLKKMQGFARFFCNRIKIKKWLRN